MATRNNMARKKKPTLDEMLGVVTHDDLHEWSSRLDKAVEKFADAITELSVTLGRHTERLDSYDKMMDELKQNQVKLSEKIGTETTSIKEHIDTKVGTVAKRVGTLERWRWLIVGGWTVAGMLAAVIAFLFSIDANHIDAFLHYMKGTTHTP